MKPYTEDIFTPHLGIWWPLRPPYHMWSPAGPTTPAASGTGHKPVDPWIKDHEDWRSKPPESSTIMLHKGDPPLILHWSSYALRIRFILTIFRWPQVMTTSVSRSGVRLLPLQSAIHLLVVTLGKEGARVVMVRTNQSLGQRETGTPNSLEHNNA